MRRLRWRGVLNALNWVCLVIGLAGIPDDVERWAGGLAPVLSRVDSDVGRWLLFAAGGGGLLVVNWAWPAFRDRRHARMPKINRVANAQIRRAVRELRGELTWRDRLARLWPRPAERLLETHEVLDGFIETGERWALLIRSTGDAVPAEDLARWGVAVRRFLLQEGWERRVPEFDTARFSSCPPGAEHVTTEGREQLSRLEAQMEIVRDIRRGYGP